MNTSTNTFLALGECMVEMAPAGQGLHRMGFAGDTFNAAWYARRLLGTGWRVAYGTCVGRDAVSDAMLEYMRQGGIDTDEIRRVDGRSVGLYLISLKDGERSFSYWRSQSAARLLADDAAWLDRVCGAARAIHVSGITLAILTPERRETLCAALGYAREAGALVALDTNLRPALWESETAMRAGLTAAASVADVVLPSFDEDAPLFGDVTPEDTIARYRDAGAACVCVKNGAGPVELWSREQGRAAVAPVAGVEVVDTTAAGDSFAAGFLAALLQGSDAETAAIRAAALAARVIGARGALVEV